MENIYFLFIAGAIGALTKDIFDDGCIQLPFKKDGKLYLGFISSIIIGGFVGYLKDGSLLTAAMGGFVGYSVLESLIGNKKIETTNNLSDIERIIEYICKEQGISADLAIRIAKCESNLNPKAINTNTDGSRDRGIFQINNKWHPEVTDEQAFDPTFSTKFFCEAFKNGHLDWWNSSKKCWDK